MPQFLRHVPFFQRTWVKVPPPTQQLPTVTPGLGYLIYSLAIEGTRHAHIVHRHRCRKIPCAYLKRTPYIFKNKKKFSIYDLSHSYLGTRITSKAASFLSCPWESWVFTITITRWLAGKPLTIFE